MRKIDYGGNFRETLLLFEEKLNLTFDIEFQEDFLKSRNYAMRGI